MTHAHRDTGPWFARAWLGTLVLLVAFGPGPVAAAGLASPETGTPEWAIRESLRLLRDGKPDEWIANFCDPTKCTGDNTEELKTYDLHRATVNAPKCLHGDEEGILVTRMDGDPQVDATLKIFIQCEDSRMPVPATMKKRADGRWLFTSFSW
jgi:hypothetical protein